MYLAVSGRCIGVVLFRYALQQELAVSMALVHNRFCQAVDEVAEDMVTGQFDVEHFFGTINLFISRSGTGFISLFGFRADLLDQRCIIGAGKYVRSYRLPFSSL